MGGALARLQPAWSYGKDFIVRSRLVPESTPEFSASDAYVNELLARPEWHPNRLPPMLIKATKAEESVPELVEWCGKRAGQSTPGAG